MNIFIAITFLIIFVVAFWDLIYFLPTFKKMNELEKRIKF